MNNDYSINYIKREIIELMVRVLFWFCIPLAIFTWARMAFYGFMPVMVIHTMLFIVMTFIYLKRHSINQYIIAHVLVIITLTLGIIGVPQQGMPIYGYPMGIVSITLATFFFNRGVANKYLALELSLIFIFGIIYGNPHRYFQYAFEFTGYFIFQYFLILSLDKIRIHLSETIDDLNDAVRTKERFLALMSHEIRTPLHGITLAAENILNSEDENDRAEMADIITTSSSHLKGIIDDLLDFSKLNQEKLITKNEYFWLSPFISKLERDYRNQAESKKIRFEVNNLSQLEGLIGDSFRLEQVLRNLLSNAFKFTSSGYVKVSFKLDESNKNVLIEVEDTGVGISEDRIDSIFKEFEQESVEVASRFGGTGLGLAIVKALTEKMGGDVNVSSEIGEGTTFSLCFPFDEERVQLEKDKLKSEAAKNRHENEEVMSLPSEFQTKRILIVEDNDINVKVLQKRLSSLGLENTVVARNGEEALERCRSEKFDLIFMDVRMPILDGLEATKTIRDGHNECLNQETAIVGLSANSFETDVKKGMKAGMNGYLGKPFSKDDLFETLMKFLNS